MKKLLSIGLGVVVIAGGIGAGVFGGESLVAAFDRDAGEESGEEARPATPVTVEAPRETEILDTFEAVGTVLPARSVALSPMAEGRVTEVLIESGQRVRAGDVLLRLDDRAERAALDDARATLTETEASFRRYEALLEDGTSPEAQFEVARGLFARAQAAVEVAEANLADRTLTAPFDGILGVVDLDPGAQVDAATIVTTLDDLSSVEIEFAVPERYFAAAEIGQTVLFDGPIYPDRTFEGEVALVAPRIDANSRSFVVRGTIPNDDGALVGGMFGNVTLVLGSGPALTLPDSAIISEGSATYVYAVEEDVARRTDVVLGRTQEGRTAVTDGLAPDSQVAVTGYDRLSDGDEVTVQDAGSDAGESDTDGEAGE